MCKYIRPSEEKLYICTQVYRQTSLRMQIKQIKIENFKGITLFEMNMGDSLNTFIGANGSGKSTIIEAIDMLLSWVVARVRTERGQGDLIHPNQIRKGAQYARLSIDVELEGERYKWSLYKKANQVRKKLPDDSSDLVRSSACANKIVEIINQRKIAPPIISSFGVNRAVDEIPKGISKRKHKLKPEDIYDKGTSSIRFRSLFEWMLERQDIENEEYRAKSEAGELFTEDEQLATVKRAIEKVFDSDYTNLKVKSHPRRVTIEKSEGTTLKEYELDLLSDGEKCYLAIVASIARLLAMATPPGQDPLESSGIILIDEVDLHLHPEWQLTIVPRLTKTFPNCQFIFTTHSPHVISSIPSSDSSKLVVMEEGVGQEIESGWYGRESDSILLKYFGLSHVRNNKVHHLLREIWQELNQNNDITDHYKDLKSQLQSLLNPNDPAIFELQLQEALIAKRQNEKNK